VWQRKKWGEKSPQEEGRSFEQKDFKLGFFDKVKTHSPESGNKPGQNVSLERARGVVGPARHPPKIVESPEATAEEKVDGGKGEDS